MAFARERGGSVLKKGLGLGLASMLVAGVPAQSQTSDAVTYTYDALGRLVQTSHSGTVNNGVNSTYSYDPASNRTNVTVTGAAGTLGEPSGGTDPGGGPPPGGGGNPGGGGSNQPPVAQNDNGGTVALCSYKSVNVIANDTDPEGHYPLTLVGIQGVSPSSRGEAGVESSTNVGFTSYGSSGSVQVTYVVQDSQGATSTGVLTLNVAGGGCW